MLFFDDFQGIVVVFDDKVSGVVEVGVRVEQHSFEIRPPKISREGTNT